MFKNQVTKKYPDVTKSIVEVAGMQRGKTASHNILEWIVSRKAGVPDRRYTVKYRVTDRPESALQIGLTVYKFATNRSIYTGFSLPIEATRDLVGSLVEMLARVEGEGDTSSTPQASTSSTLQDEQAEMVDRRNAMEGPRVGKIEN